MADIEALRTAAAQRAARSIRLGDVICTWSDEEACWSRVTAILSGQNVLTKQKVLQFIAKDLDGLDGCKTNALPDDLILSVPAKLARKLVPEVADA